MNHTALSAVHMVIYPQGFGGGDMVKMRLQGTKEDMEWLEHQLSQLPNVQITESSDIYRNKGSNLINNSRVSPTNGIVKLAEIPELTETVRECFRELFADDGGDITERQNRIENFRDKINELLEKYELGKWKYSQEFRTVLFYLNMYRPSENYLFKATEAKKFMYCTEYGDDFGTTSSVFLF